MARNELYRCQSGVDNLLLLLALVQRVEMVKKYEL